jgi:hypothetical protein
VHSQDPLRHGAAVVLILRWEAVSQGGRPFPALDADITLVPDGEHAVLVRLTGVCRQPPGTRSGQTAAQTVAAAAIRTLLTRIADAVSDPAAPAAEGKATAIPPGRQAWASLATTWTGPRSPGQHPRPS